MLLKIFLYILMIHKCMNLVKVCTYNYYCWSQSVSIFGFPRKSQSLFQSGCNMFFFLESVWGSSVFLGICPSHLELQTSWAGTLSPCPLLFDVCSILTEAPPPFIFDIVYLCLLCIILGQCPQGKSGFCDRLPL